MNTSEAVRSMLHQVEVVQEFSEKMARNLEKLFKKVEQQDIFIKETWIEEAWKHVGQPKDDSTIRIEYRLVKNANF